MHLTLTLSTNVVEYERAMYDADIRHQIRENCFQQRIFSTLFPDGLNKSNTNNKYHISFTAISADFIPMEIVGIRYF